MKSGSLILLEPSGPVQACNGIALPLPLLNKCWSANGGRCQGANGRRQAHHVFSIMVLSLYYDIESEYEIKTMALGVGSVTTPSLFS